MNKITFFLLTAILLIHILVLTKLIFFPYPEFFIYPYLTNNGFKPYNQILDQHFPGLMFLPVNFNNLGMINEIVARGWLIGVVILTQLLLFFTSRKLLGNNKKALLVSLLYLIWQPFFEGWTFWIDSLLPLLLLPSLYFAYQFLESKFNKWVFLSGLFLGIGVVFKQILLPLSALLFIYLIFRSRKLNTGIYFILGFLPPILLTIVYLFSIGVIKDFWYWTVTFNLTVFSQYGRKLPTLTQIIRLSFILIFAGSAVLERKKWRFELLAIFIVGALVAIYARFDFIHFQPALPFVLLATALGFESINKLNLKRGAILLYFIVAAAWLTIFYKGHLQDKVFFFDNGTKTIASKVTSLTKSGEKIFIFGTVPHLYQMTSTLPAGDIFVFQFSWFLKVAGDRVLDGLVRDRPNIIISDRNTEIEGIKIKDYAPKIDDYIQQNYEEIDHVGSASIMRRR